MDVAILQRRELSELQWSRIEPLLPGGAWTGRPRADQRNLIEGILFVLRTGCRWRDMPRQFGSHITAWRRLQELSQEGAWHRIWTSFQSALDEIGRLEWQHYRP